MCRVIWQQLQDALLDASLQRARRVKTDARLMEKEMKERLGAAALERKREDSATTREEMERRLSGAVRCCCCLGCPVLSCPVLSCLLLILSCLVLKTCRVFHPVKSRVERKLSKGNRIESLNPLPAYWCLSEGWSPFAFYKNGRNGNWHDFRHTNDPRIPVFPTFKQIFFFKKNKYSEYIYIMGLRRRGGDTTAERRG